MNKAKFVNRKETSDYRSMMLYDHDACCSSINQGNKKETTSPNYRSMTYGASSMANNDLRSHKSDSFTFLVEKQNKQNSANNYVLKKDQLDNGNDNDWIIFPWQIQSIPKLYPLESSHRIINDADIKDIIQNLVRCFQKLNLRATYQNDKKPTTRAILKSKQNDDLDINLYLWKIENNTICIELQRRVATSDRIIFHRYAKLILEAATLVTTYDNEDDHWVPSNNGGRKQSFGATKMNSFFPNKCYSAVKKTNQHYNYQHERQQQEQKEVTSSIELVKSLLLQESNSIDTQLLGMKSLCILTDSKKTNISISYFLSCAVIFGSNFIVDSLRHTATTANLNAFIMKLIGNDNDKNDDSIIDEIEDYDSDDDEYYDSDDDDYEEDSYFASRRRKQDMSGIKQTLKHLGLTALSNSLETLFTLVIKNTDARQDLLFRRNSFNKNTITLIDYIQFCNTAKLIINNLLKELTTASANNYLALKCLRLFCELSFFFEKQGQREFVATYLEEKSGILLKIVSEERGEGTHTTKPRQEECKRLVEVLEVLLEVNDNEQ